MPECPEVYVPIPSYLPLPLVPSLGSALVVEQTCRDPVKTCITELCCVLCALQATGTLPAPHAYLHEDFVMLLLEP